MVTRTTLLAVLAALSASLFAAATQAQVYKWTDERGGVHYSNAPPPEGIPPARVATIAEKVSTYAPVTPAAPAVPAPGADAALKTRVQALEQELAAERRARDSANTVSADDRRRAELDECLRQRRADCDRPEVLATGAAPMMVVAPPRRRATIVPTLPAPKAEPKVTTAPLSTGPFGGPRARPPL
jgi:hypothetical protein